MNDVDSQFIKEPANAETRHLILVFKKNWLMPLSVLVLRNARD